MWTFSLADAFCVYVGGDFKIQCASRWCTLLEPFLGWWGGGDSFYLFLHVQCSVARSPLSLSRSRVIIFVVLTPPFPPPPPCATYRTPTRTRAPFCALFRAALSSRSTFPRMTIAPSRGSHRSGSTFQQAKSMSSQHRVMLRAI